MDLSNVISLNRQNARLNVLASSTLYWNPGDDWIRTGCLNLIREALRATGNQEFNLIYYNRSPDCMKNRKMSSEIEKMLMGNYVNTFKKRNIDLVVACGSPEWCGPPHKALHEKLLGTKIPYILLGVGTTKRGLTFNDLDREIFLRNETTIFTRSQEAADDINKELKRFKAVALPCPAMFCTLGGIHKSKEKVQVAQSYAGTQAVKPALLHGMSTKIPVVAERWEEWEAWLNAGFNVEYSPEPAKLLMQIGRYKTIYTTRLHAAIAAMATGSSAVIVNKGDFRIESAAKMFGIPVVENFSEAFEAIPKALDDDFKWKMWRTYLDNLKEILGRHVENRS